MENKPKLFSVLTVLTFFLILIAFLIGALTLPDREFSQTENRTLEQKPEINASVIKSGSFMSRFESYMSDQFPLREKIVSVKAYSQRLLGETRQNNVYIGKDGWLFEKPAEYDAEKVSKTVSALSEFSQNCKIPNQVFMLVPNSSYFLKDELPPLLSVPNQAKQIKAITKKLPNTINSVDSTKMFNEKDNLDELFYKTDHHWTTKGAKLAFDRTAYRLNLDTSKAEYEFYTVSNDFNGTLSSSSGIYNTTDTVEICVPKNSKGTYFIKNADTKEKSATLFDMSKLEDTNKYEVFFGGNFSRIVISTSNLNGKNLLIFKDSYANCFIPLLTPYYQNIVVIDARYFTDDINAVLSDYKFTDMLVLYNVNTFLEDTSLKDILKINK